MRQGGIYTIKPKRVKLEANLQNSTDRTRIRTKCIQHRHMMTPPALRSPSTTSKRKPRGANGVIVDSLPRTDGALCNLAATHKRPGRWSIWTHEGNDTAEWTQRGTPLMGSKSAARGDDSLTPVVELLSKADARRLHPRWLLPCRGSLQRLVIVRLGPRPSGGRLPAKRSHRRRAAE